MTRQMYINSVVPIGALFSGTLWFGNAAYTYLSVSFIQMLKALMPAAVFMCGLAWGVEKKDYSTMGAQPPPSTSFLLHKILLALTPNRSRTARTWAQASWRSSRWA